MREREEEYTVSTSHVGLRIAGLVAAVVVAVVAFSYGFTKIGYKAPGYYEIRAAASDEAPFYQNGFSFFYYFEGSSDEIKLEMERLKDVYGAALLYSYKLLDPDNTYEGLVNMASLNDSLGEKMRVSDELLFILQDLWEKTGEDRGVNLFSGSLLREWDSILSLDDLSEFDPALHPEIAERLAILAEKTADRSNFSFEISEEKREIRLAASDEYLDFLHANGYGSRLLTAGRLADAYRLKLIKGALEAQGFTNGYLCTESGLTLSLSGHEEGQFVLYGYEDGAVVQCRELTAGANSACSFLRAFPMQKDEIMYHVVESDQGQRFYHPWFVLDTGEFADVLSSSCTVRYDGDIVAACYENIALYNLPDRADVGAAVGGDTTIACTFLGKPAAEVYFRPAAE